LDLFRADKNNISFVTTNCIGRGRSVHAVSNTRLSRLLLGIIYDVPSMGFHHTVKYDTTPHAISTCTAHKPDD